MVTCYTVAGDPVARPATNEPEPDGLLQMIRKGEHSKVAFKSTLRVDVRTDNPEKYIQVEFPEIDGKVVCVITIRTKSANISRSIGIDVRVKLLPVPPVYGCGQNPSIMSSKLYGLFLAIGLFMGSCKAQDQGRTQDPSTFIKLDSWMEENAPVIGGRAILLIYKDGQPVYSKSVNEMSRKQKMVNKFVARKMKKEANSEDYTASTRQPIASCSKWLSAALVMTFVDEGRLQLTDTVGKFLPVLSQHGKGMITISQCLSHLTAIQEPELKESLKKITRMTTMDESIAWLADLPMEGQPGKVFHYSNAGLQIAAAVIEKISGESFQTLFAERIAHPLDMKNTDFGQTRVALPAGGAGSTPEDYMNFLSMIQQRGVFHGHRVLSEHSVAEMQVNRITHDVRIAYTPVKNNGGEGVGYGFGEWVFLEPGTGASSGSVASPGLFGSIPWVDNKRGYCGFLMTFYLNNKGREDRLRELKRTVDEAIDPVSAVSK